MYLYVNKKNYTIESFAEIPEQFNAKYFFVDVGNLFNTDVLLKNGEDDVVSYKLKNALTEIELGQEAPIIKNNRDGKIEHLYTQIECANLELEKNKKNIYRLIDKICSELINDGFEFKGKQFSLSIAAQSNWAALKLWLFNGLNDENNEPLAEVEISTKDDDYYLIKKEDIEPFTGTALFTVQNTMQFARQEKRKAKNATSHEMLESQRQDIISKYEKYIYR